MYSLEAGARRNVIVCNWNLHRNERHLDRRMDVHDLIYIVSGEWKIAQDEETYVVRAGDVILLAAGHHHYGPVPCDGEVRTIYVHFQAHESDGMSDSATPDRDRYCFPVVSHLPPGSPVPALLEQMVNSYWMRDVYAPERASDYLSLALCELSLLTAGMHAAADSRELVKRLMRAMEMNPEQFYSVEKLAGMIGVSVRTLHNYFREVTGMPPRAYQIAVKLEAARQTLMSDERLPLRELAARYGFCDEYHFSKLYKARFGCAPKSEERHKNSRED